MTSILIIDNYDSFTYNLYQEIAQQVDQVRVVRNDVMSVDEIRALAPKALVISPGPGAPAQAGICIPLIQALASTTPILGVCLGLQAMVEAFGGRVGPAPEIVHGKASTIFHRRRGLFKRLPLPFQAGRYHSLAAVRDALPGCLTVEADTPDGLIMAVQHTHYACYGVQFHPESYLTPQGGQLIADFLEIAGVRRSVC